MSPREPKRGTFPRLAAEISTSCKGHLRARGTKPRSQSFGIPCKLTRLIFLQDDASAISETDVSLEQRDTLMSRKLHSPKPLNASSLIVLQPRRFNFLRLQTSAIVSQDDREYRVVG
jgi:hypothetical protein